MHSRRNTKINKVVVVVLMYHISIIKHWLQQILFPNWGPGLHEKSPHQKRNECARDVFAWSPSILGFYSIIGFRGLPLKHKHFVTVGAQHYSALLNPNKSLLLQGFLWSVIRMQMCYQKQFAFTWCLLAEEPFSLIAFCGDFNICHNFKNSNIYIFYHLHHQQGCYLGLGEDNFP